MTSFLVTGGTGSFGQAFIRELLARHGRDGTQSCCARIVVFSRDELKQHQMQLDGLTDPRLRYFIGDVRDRDRLRRAMEGIDTVVHAAALKQVPACEYNPLEAKKTNIDGTQNVIDAAIDAGVKRVLMLSSDKACDPTNLYGKTKAVAEALMVDANVYARNGFPKFACTRYGNVLGSRGSVLPLFQAQHAAGLPLTVTDLGMTRFVLTLEQGVQFVLDSLGRMSGGEIFVPKVPAVKVATIAEAVAWPAQPHVTVSGVRAGEKRHETLISAHEAPRTTVLEYGGGYVIAPLDYDRKVILPAGFVYSSDSAEQLDGDAFRQLAGLGT